MTIEQNEEQVKSLPTEEQEQTTPETPSEENMGAEAKEPEPEQTPDPMLVDEDGIPWKQRAKENERKYQKALEKLANSEQGQPESNRIDDDTEILNTVGGVKQVMHQLSRQEQQADTILDEVIEGLAFKRPEINDFKKEIAEQLKAVDVSKRMDKGLIEAVAYSVYGKAQLERKQEQAKATPKKLVSMKQSDVMPPSSKGGASTDVTLTEEEREYAEHHNLDRKGFSNEEIRDMMKYQKKKK